MKLSRQSSLVIAITAGWLAVTSGCMSSKNGDRKSTAGDSAADGEVTASSSGGSSDELDLSNTLRTVPLSNSNNSLTPGSVNRARAEEAAQKLEAAAKNDGGRDRANLIGLMAAQRMAGMGLNQVMATARKLMEVELKANINRDLPEIAKLEIVLTSIRTNRLAMAEHYLGDLLKSKNAKVRAAALTAQGMIAQSDGRTPEAISAWQEALKVVPEYPPAALNVGFAALRAGDVKTAKQTLGGLQENWFAVSGLIIAERLSGENAKAGQLCDRLLGQRPRYKPALYNCALLEFQANKNYDKAKSLLDRFQRAPGSKGEFEEKAYRLMSRIDVERGQKASQDAAKKDAPAEKPADQGRPQ